MWSACVEPVLGGSPRVGTHDCRPCVSDSACPSHLLGVSRPYGDPHPVCPERCRARSCPRPRVRVLTLRCLPSALRQIGPRVTSTSHTLKHPTCLFESVISVYPSAPQGGN